MAEARRTPAPALQLLSPPQLVRREGLYRAYDSDTLDTALPEKGIEMIAPQEQEEAEDPGRAQAQALQEALGDRAALRLAGELPAASGPLRETGRKLFRLRASLVHRYPAEVLVRRVLVETQDPMRAPRPK